MELRGYKNKGTVTLFHDNHGEANEHFRNKVTVALFPIFLNLAGCFDFDEQFATAHIAAQEYDVVIACQLFAERSFDFKYLFLTPYIDPQIVVENFLIADPGLRNILSMLNQVFEIPQGFQYLPFRAVIVAGLVADNAGGPRYQNLIAAR